MSIVRSLEVDRDRARFARVLIAWEGGGDKLASIDYLAYLVWKVYDV